MNINIRSLMEGLSYALDVAEKTYFSHSKHVAYLSASLSFELGMSIEESENVYYAALLHDIGASNSYDIQDHCIKGADIVSTLPVDAILSKYVLYHHEFYDGSGPFQQKQDDIPFPAQLICFSNTFELRFGSKAEFNMALMVEIDAWLEDCKDLFHPLIIEAFLRLVHMEVFQLDYYNSDFNGILRMRLPYAGKRIDFCGVKAFAFAFSKIIDNRSPFTHRHSLGISELVGKITDALGYDQSIQQKMLIAALLHDIGKLVIPNDIIDKQGRLTIEERNEINKHTYYTRWILEHIEGFEEITSYASNHHEKLNGTGYPMHYKEEQLGELDRVLAICDIYQALTEDRPYRQNMPQEKAWSIIEEMAANKELDVKLVEKIKLIIQNDNH